MYVTATSPRFSRGRSTPATRAIGPSARSALSRLVPRVLADDPRHALTLDDLAMLAAHLDRRPYFHRSFVLAISLLEPIRDPATGEVVRRQLELHTVAGQDANEVHPHLPADVREHLVPVLELDPEHRVGQRLDHHPLDLDRVFFRHHPRLAGAVSADWPVRLVSTSGPFSVTATVCSKCAARLPSCVTAVQPSSRILTSQLPIVTIGSIASTIPARSCGPRPGSQKLGIWGSSCSARPMPWPTNARTIENPCASTCDWTACDTSDSRRSGRHSWMARSRLSRVTSSSFCTFAGTGPTGRVNAQSA